MIRYFDNVYKGSRKDFNNILFENLKLNNKMFIITANSETFSLVDSDTEMSKIILNKNNFVVPDGISIVRALKLLKFKVKERIPGIEIAEQLFDYADKLNKKIYLYGAQQKVLDKLIVNLNKKYPNMIVVGYKNGYDDNFNSVFEDIKNEKPDIVMVALGIPKQEKVISQIIDNVDNGIYIGVGGSFDVLSGYKKRAPLLLRKVGLEWLYRVYKEPRRIKKFVRYNFNFGLKIMKLKLNVKKDN